MKVYLKRKEIFKRSNKGMRVEKNEQDKIKKGWERDSINIHRALQKTSFTYLVCPQKQVWPNMSQFNHTKTNREDRVSLSHQFWPSCCCSLHSWKSVVKYVEEWIHTKGCKARKRVFIQLTKYFNFSGFTLSLEKHALVSKDEDIGSTLLQFVIFISIS